MSGGQGLPPALGRRTALAFTNEDDSTPTFVPRYIPPSQTVNYGCRNCPQIGIMHKAKVHFWRTLPTHSS
jgi:hypothetical protein